MMYKMYGAEFSLYSGKVRSYLLKKGIPFEEITPSMKVYKEFIVPRTGVRYIPVLQTPEDDVLQDTTVIIDSLEKKFPVSSVYPATPKQKLLALLFEVYGDEWLLIPAMHYRWFYRKENYKYITSEFGKMLFPKLPKFMQAFLGKKVAARFQGAVERLGVTDANRKAIEASYEQLLADLNTHFSQYNYLFGERPSIGDYGFIGPFYAHLYRDPYSGNRLRKQAPAVAGWVERMLSDDKAQGDFLANDHIPETLLPILQRFSKEQLPTLLDTDKRLAAWKNENHIEQNKQPLAIPRFIGQHDFIVEGVKETRVVIPYSLWMFQRPLDFYQNLRNEDKHRLGKLFESTGINQALEIDLQARMQRVNNQLYFV